MERNSLRRGTMLATAITALVLLAATFLIFAPPPPALGSSETPATPSSVSLSRADGTVTASWPAVSGATKYHATYSTDGGGSWQAPVDDHTNITTTSITFNADNAKSYIVGLRAGNDNGQWSGWRNSPEAGPYTPPDANPPAAVGSITLNRSDATLTVSWNAVSGADKYHAVYQADGGDWLPPVPGHENITTTSFTFNIDNGKSYVVGVRAGNANGWGPWTDSPASHPPLPAAVGSITLNRSDTTLTVSWNAVDGAANYHALYQADGAGDWLPPITDYQNITATGFTFDVDNNKSYVVGVRAGNSAGWGPWTDSPASGPYTPPTPTPNPTPEPEPPAIPAGLTAAPGDGSITLAWDDPGDSTITGYEYNVNHNDTSTGNLSGWSDWKALAGSGAATTSHTFTGLTNGKEYRYHLRAVNSGGHGAAAPNAAPWYVVAVPAVPLPAAPANLSVTPGDGYLDITWDAMSGATGYDVRAKTAGSSDWHDVASNITTTSHRYTTDATIDYVAVRARNANGPGNWTELSRLPAFGWLNTVQQQGASINTSSLPPPPSLAAPVWGTITRSDDAKRRSGRIDVNWTGDSNATGYNLVCAVAWSESAGWNWHPCGWIDSTTDTVKFTTVPANASQPVGIVSYKRGAESQLPPGIIPLEGSQVAHSIPRMYAVAIRAVSATPNEASTWTPSASIKPLNPQLSNLAHTRTDGQIALSWTPNPYTTGYEIDCAVLDSSYTRCATLTNQDHSDAEHSVTISTWTAGGTNYAIDNSSIYDIRICSANTWGYGCYLAPLINPNPALTVSNVGMTTATLTIAHHTGNWYYKHTNTGATCEGPVSGTSKELTGLTANTSYTYSAYSDSGCTSGNLLATAAEFTTLVGDKASVSNLDETASSLLIIGSSGTGSAHAQEFTTGNTTGVYKLTSFTVDFAAVINASAVTVAIHDRQSDGTPSATARAMTLSGTVANGQAEFTCSSNCELDANTSYFVSVSASAANAAYLNSTTSDEQTLTPTGTGWSIANAARQQSANTWPELSSGQSMRIEVTAKVEATLTSSSVTSTTATLTIGGHTGAWWYERTAPSGDTTCHSVAAGTTTANLSSLTAGTSYTYKAYDKSGCNSADEIATATFTTPSS